MASHLCLDTCNCSRAQCQTCLDLDWDLYPSDSGGGYPESRDIFTNIGNIEESADIGCELCVILNTGIKRFILLVVEKSSEYADGLYAADVHICIRRGHALEVHLIRNYDTLLRLEFFSQIGHSTPWPAFGPAEEAISTLNLECCSKFARKWINNCENIHSESCHQGDHELPKRVLDLGVDDTSSTLRLKETKGERGRYITLSHRWGDPNHQFSTTKANLSNLLHGVPIDELCPTFKDAIAITRKLGIQYLWIDSLCIIQNDSQDWKLESGKMADVYSSSYLTLAVTHGADGQQGCFSTRWTRGNGNLDLPRMKFKAVTIAFKLSEEGRGGHVLVRHSHHLAHDDIWSLTFVSKEISPLLTRAWVLQELLLSNRILHFHAEEMVWECRGCSACECGILNSPSSPNASISGSANSMLSDNKQLFIENSVFYQAFREMSLRSLFWRMCAPDTSQEMKNLNWFRIISQYVKMDLTKEADRIVAISGLANTASTNRSSSDTYLAGIWEENLGESLLWTVPWAHRRIITRSPRSNNPTWSWTSIHFSGPPVSTGLHLVSLQWSLRGPTNDEPLNITFSFSNIKAVCEPEEENPFGPVIKGLLSIRSLYIVAKASYGYYMGEDFARIILDFKGAKELVVSDISPMVALSPAELEEDVICLLMGIHKTPVNQHSLSRGSHYAIWNVCMALKASPNKPGKYERFGVLYNEKDRSWFIDAVEKTFEIV